MKSRKILTTLFIIALLVLPTFFDFNKSPEDLKTLPLPDQKAPEEVKKDTSALVIMVCKSDKTLAVCRELSGDTVACFTVRTGLNPGAKMKRGDKKTPEGEYKIIAKYRSRYVRFLALNYPNKDDITAKRTGGSIGIHYLGKEMTGRRTRAEGSSGCMSLWHKEEILKLDSLVSVGTRVFIRE